MCIDIRPRSPRRTPGLEEWFARRWRRRRGQVGGGGWCWWWWRRRVGSDEGHACLPPFLVAATPHCSIPLLNNFPRRHFLLPRQLDAVVHPPPRSLRLAARVDDGRPPLPPPAASPHSPPQADARTRTNASPRCSGGCRNPLRARCVPHPWLHRFARHLLLTP